MDPKLIKKVMMLDKMATWAITGGGIFVIICVLGILLIIAKVAVPLFLPPQAEPRSALQLQLSDKAALVSLGMDGYRENLYALTASGELGFFDAEKGARRGGQQLSRPDGARGIIARAERFGGGRHSLLWSDGSLSVVRIGFEAIFDEQGRRSVEPRVETLASLPPLLSMAEPTGLANGQAVISLGRHDEETGTTRVSLLAGNRLLVEKKVLTENLLGEAEEEDFSTQLTDELPGRITALVLSQNGDTLYAGSANGYLLRWDLSEAESPVLLDRLTAFEDRRGITVLQLAQGQDSLLVGDNQGGVSGWFPVPGDTGPQGEGGRHLALVHRFKPHQGPVKAIWPFNQSKSLLSLGADGLAHLSYLSNERHLLTLGEDAPLQMVFLNPRDNGLIGLDRSGEVQAWNLRIPHPEVGWGAYFGEVWYESYPEPAYVWQSSSGSDDFEPKLSLMPLVFGTLKGTLYGMLFAAPLGILSAMYTSHLMNARLRRYIKPTFEIMGSVPTVVIGFLAALWLAPLVKASLTAFFLFLGVLPLTVVVALMLFDRFARSSTIRRMMRGYEFLFMLPMLLLGFYVSFQLGAWLDGTLFGGGLPTWLFESMDIRFDQRNSIIISSALGFAVLPIVYTISDDALTNVPRNLTAASLALGASRWQTVWRVILPSASPGIFAALMVGLGRAIGETMIVLMATGNTPIMDWSVFNGMRTLSANIAVEIPEAPLDSTLYRTLFLSAVLLFMTTFVLNSLAEVVRQRLRKKFGNY